MLIGWRCCSLQVDVEGSELQVLQGIEARHWPCIKQVLPLLLGLGLGL